MFNNLTNKFQGIFRNLTGRGILTESNIKESMEEIRTALLDADVNYDVASRFVQECATECLGTEVLRNIKPGQQVVKVVYDKLTSLLGENSEPLQIAQGDPAVIMLCGLHGSGKTTTTAKLAKHLRDRYHKKVMLIACDVYRPAAIDQIESLGADLGFKV
ncbi:MAG: signal recognition particle receptor subunit alpha, partial [Victivallales bacterium]|nr:signal recognition particle receptor subunit alpha [Victivallales bacterium]